MAAFYGRLMALSTVNEGSQRSFTRTHPLSIERMSDMQNRARGVTPHPQPNPADFYFVRAKLRVLQASSGQETIDAIRYLESRAQETTGVEKAAFLYGSGVGYLQRRDYVKARAAYDAATSGARDHFMLAQLAIDIAAAQGDHERALTLARSAAQRWPEQRGLALTLGECLQRAGRNTEALAYLQEQMLRWSDESRFYQMTATTYGALNQPVAERRTMADYYAMTGAMPAALELLTQARAASKDFYEQSQIDARVRDLQRRIKEEKDLLKRFES
jgi:predicted Zn-dependent protease